MFMSNNKCEFVPHDQVSPLLVVYCSLFLQVISGFTQFFIHNKYCFKQFCICSYSMLSLNSQLKSDVCCLPFMLWFNFILGLNFISLCFQVW